MIDITCPNLDCMTEEDLAEAALIFDLLAKCARHLMHAVRCRRSGRIAVALRHEQEAQVVYDLLPEHIQW